MEVLLQFSHTWFQTEFFHTCVPNCAQNRHYTRVKAAENKEGGTKRCWAATNKRGCGRKFHVKETQAQGISDVAELFPTGEIFRTGIYVSSEVSYVLLPHPTGGKQKPPSSITT